MELEKISSSLEDYLEEIAEIIEDNGHAHTYDIADKLHVKMQSVTSALQTLSAKGLIRYQSHAPVVLTAAGSERAAVIRLRHAAFNNFFREILKLSPEEANDTASKVELTDSVRYREGLGERAIFSAFRDWAMGTDAASLHVRVSRPILPGSAPRRIR